MSTDLFQRVLSSGVALARPRKQLVSVLSDLTIASLALWSAFSIWRGGATPEPPQIAPYLIIVPVISVIVFNRLGIYRWVIRSSNIRLGMQLAKGALFTGGVLLAMVYGLSLVDDQPVLLSAVFSMLLFCGTVATRLAWRRLFDAGSNGVPIAIYGAGSAGVQLASSLASSAEYRPVCYIDDSPAFRDATVSGLPVLCGSDDQLGDQLSHYEATEVVIAIPSMGSTDYARLLARLEPLNIPFKTLPAVSELVSGAARLEDIREISISDILGRTEVPANPDLLSQCATDRSILVTGGGGSIGSELCRQILALKPTKLIVVDNCEANLYQITEEVHEVINSDPSLAKLEFVPVLCSVSDEPRMTRLFAEQTIDIVFHAAAYKHVPIIESFPGQAVEVNIFGTRTVLNAAVASGVKSFVLISTDKAVRPTNAMGATKRIAELVLQAKAQENHGTTISMVRFGNVLASSGSVVPKFLSQIENGGPLTITHRDITRYFMTIPEAARLVMQASVIATGGDVFVLDMGEPVKIKNLAENMLRLDQRKRRSAGLPPRTVRIVETGLRPGEKMHEELFEGANCSGTRVRKVLMANESLIDPMQLQQHLETLESCGTQSAAEIKEILLDIVDQIPKPSKMRDAMVRLKSEGQINARNSGTAIVPPRPGLPQVV